MAQQGGGQSVPLPPAILSLLGGGGGRPPSEGAGLGQPPPRTETGSSSSTVGGLPPDDALARASQFLDPIGGSVGDRGGMNDGWNSSRTFDLSSLSSGGSGEAYGGLTPSLQAQLNSMRNEAGRESVDSNSDRLTGAVLSELANSALNELMQQVRPPAARCTRARA